MDAHDYTRGDQSDWQAVEECIRKGETLLEGGSFEDALRMFEKAVSIDPDHVYARMQRASALAVLGRTDEAYSHIDDMVRSVPDMSVPDLINAAYMMITLHEYDRALELVERATATDPTYTHVYHARALVMAQIGRIDDARACINDALRVDPKDYVRYDEIADRCITMGSHVLAMTYLNRLIRMNHNAEMAYKKKILMLYETGRRKAALRACNDAIKMFPRDYLVNITRAHVLLKMGKLQDAQKAAKTASATRPDESVPYRIMSDVMMHAKKYDSALRYLTRAINLSPDDYLLRRSRCALLIDMNKNKEAAAQSKALLKTHDEDFFLHFVMGTAQFKMGKHQGALASMRKALKRAPDHAHSHHHMGLILLYMNKPKEALASLTKAAELDPKDANIQVHLGTALAFLGRNKDAEECIARGEAMGADPEHVAEFRMNLPGMAAGNSSGGRAEGGATRWTVGRGA